MPGCPTSPRQVASGRDGRAGPNRVRGHGAHALDTNRQYSAAASGGKTELLTKTKTRVFQGPPACLRPRRLRKSRKAHSKSANIKDVWDSSYTQEAEQEGDVLGGTCNL